MTQTLPQSLPLPAYTQPATTAAEALERALAFVIASYDAVFCLTGSDDRGAKVGHGTDPTAQRWGLIGAVHAGAGGASSAVLAGAQLALARAMGARPEPGADPALVLDGQGYARFVDWGRRWPTQAEAQKLLVRAIATSRQS